MPPVDIFLFEESLCSSGRMFRVIILQEPVVGKFFSNERNERGLQDVADEISIHDAIKGICGMVSADSRPDMNLQRMFWFWFSLRWLVYLPVTGAPLSMMR